MRFTEKEYRVALKTIQRETMFTDHPYDEEFEILNQLLDDFHRQKETIAYYESKVYNLENSLRETIDQLQTMTDSFICTEMRNGKRWALYYEPHDFQRKAYRDTYPDPKDKTLALLVYRHCANAQKRCNFYNESRNTDFQPITLREIEKEKKMKDDKK